MQNQTCWQNLTQRLKKLLQRLWPVWQILKQAHAQKGLRPYSEDEIRKQAKFMILAMQGSWTSQQHHSWEVVNSSYEESCSGPVHMWRPNTDGTRRLETRTDTLTNRNMFLIGRIALDKRTLASVSIDLSA